MSDNHYIPCGFGIAANAKNDGSKFLSIYLQEKLPFVEGDITDKPTELNINVKDIVAVSDNV